MNMNSNKKSALISFGNRIKELRIEQEMNQEELAYRAGLDRSYISGVENGKRNISLNAIISLAKALNVDLSTLFIKVEL
ncbi:DNA-binding XRE family transcriptional regulator [Vespertiliibacter pulmonis]|uniref:DNA-binding XRE family transcriptional regulator n=2 Tax=Vespertiliibacter pulmonis TaxID=1443036 RepID=A0A3N4VXF7_9PAST|nr:DNA-binding XRE family transcriptional regulator [Vespertiliibacter pulmonis]